MQFYIPESTQPILWVLSILLVVSALGNITLKRIGPYFEYLILEDPERVEAKIASVKAMSPFTRWFTGMLVDLASNFLFFWPEWVSYRIIADAVVDDEYTASVFEHAKSLKTAGTA